jgi:hypothetical protein
MVNKANQGPAPELWRCRESFATAGAVPAVYGAGQEVLGDDPILQTHRSFFEPAADRVSAARARTPVESATAGPGERRSSVVPVITKENQTDG